MCDNNTNSCFRFMTANGRATMGSARTGCEVWCFRAPVCYCGGMVKTLELAIAKAASLPEAVQERLGRELLDRIAPLAGLLAEIEIGIRELDAGLGEELDIEAVITRST